ncbi:MAG: hypothetical protein IKE24_06390 [Clostridia bacterium]|nr:hypothetical protein [Clostridia bacterium]
MAEIGSNLKNIWMRGMEAIGNTASNIASNTRFKVQEMNLVNRRTEILKDFGAKAYALWQKGEHFPGELEAQLRELGKLDEELNDLRAEHFAGIRPEQSMDASPEEETPAQADEAGDDDAAPEAEAPAEPAEDLPQEAETEPAVDLPQEPETEPAEDIPVIRVENASEPAPDFSPISEAINEMFEKDDGAE